MDNKLINKTNKMTLTYLTNPVYYSNVHTTTNNNKIEYKYKQRDIKFYKKRILNITKDMIRGTYESEKLKNVFHNYIDNIIEHIITMDEIDIIQEDYSNIDINNLDNFTKINNEFDVSNANTYMMRTEEIISTLDNFVTINKPSDIPEFIPQKKMINLKSSLLKTKGINKNKNKI